MAVGRPQNQKKDLLSVDDVIHVKCLKALKDGSCIEEGIFGLEHLLRVEQHVEFSPWAVVHSDCCVGFARHCEPFLHQELGNRFCRLPGHFLPIIPPRMFILSLCRAAALAHVGPHQQRVVAVHLRHLKDAAFFFANGSLF